MINTNRIVPVQATDLIGLYGEAIANRVQYRKKINELEYTAR